MTHHDPTPTSSPREHEIDTSEAHISCGRIVIAFKSMEDFKNALRNNPGSLPILSHQFDPQTGLRDSSFRFARTKEGDICEGELSFAPANKTFDAVYQTIADCIGTIEHWDADFIGEDIPMGISAFRFGEGRVDTCVLITLDLQKNNALQLHMRADFGPGMAETEYAELLHLLELWGKIHSVLMSASTKEDTIEMTVRRFEPSEVSASLGFAFLMHNEYASSGTPVFDLDHIDTDELAAAYLYITDEIIATLLKYLIETYPDNELITMGDITDALDILTYDFSDQPE